MLTIEKLNKIYPNGVHAVRDLDLQVDPGRIYIMLGANGAGKTTTLMLCLGFTEPTSGRVLINGIDINKEPLKAKHHVSYVSENVQLYGNFTAVQNLEFFAKVGGKPKITRDEVVATLTRVGLPPETHTRQVKGYSKGMRQRLGIAIGIIRETELILLDEPTSGLDPKGGQEFVSLLKELRDEGRAILMTTHDIFRAKDLASSLGIMANGELVVTRTSEELQTEDLENLYITHVERSVGG
ncbi:MAG: ATP-binding cassette domain-containing protein [Chitinivibrionales bacterium]|nr:ATP-binding cassette domain-containing protein [Chitinivibrionales bacterium]